MLCPACRTRLIVTGQARLETLSEHVCDPNGTPSMKDKYECPNVTCATQGQDCWDEWGGHYCEDFRKKTKFIEDNAGPFGSIERKINVEVYKKDENFDLLKLGRFRFHLKYNYEANEDGQVLSRKRKVEMWVKDKDGIGEVLYISGLRMFFHRIGEFHRALKRSDAMKLSELTDKDNWRNQRQWWRVLSCFYARTIVRMLGCQEKQTV